MSEHPRDEEREHRIAMEIVVDAYTAEEQAMGWYCYLDQVLHFPFRARVISKRTISPLRVGEEIEIVGMAPEEECEHQMFVLMRWDGDELAVPLSQVEPMGADEKTHEAVEDWHYWVARGYEFSDW